MMHLVKTLLAALLLGSCAQAQTPGDYISGQLEIRKLSGHAYQHISFFNSETFGKVPCNGAIFFDGNEAVIFDTPPDDSTSEALIKWVEDSLRCKVKAIIPTHFHEDCLGGLKAFHQHHIPSYANNLTIQLAKQHNRALPQQGFSKALELKVGNKKVLAAFIGEGHTKDNIVGYFPDEQILFGGCLIKETGAGKGNLEDANVKDWSATVTKVKQQYPNIKTVIPGHGKTGGTELLDYTIRLFK